MAEATKNELVEQATDLGVADADKLSKAELEDRLEDLAPPELGPVVPDGEITPPPIKATGAAVEGVQPLDDDDIPDAGR